MVTIAVAEIKVKEYKESRQLADFKATTQGGHVAFLLGSTSSTFSLFSFFFFPFFFSMHITFGEIFSISCIIIIIIQSHTWNYGFNVCK